MGLKTLAIILLLLVSIWWLVRKRRESQAEAQAPMVQSRKKKTAYHAVSIKFPKDACLAARTMAGRRFLATAAPKLPLPECDASACQCQFVHHEDRRSGKDRRSPFSPTQTLAGTGNYSVEKRAGGDRRRNVED